MNKLLINFTLLASASSFANPIELDQAIENLVTTSEKVCIIQVYSPLIFKKAAIKYTCGAHESKSVEVNTDLKLESLDAYVIEQMMESGFNFVSALNNGISNPAKMIFTRD